MAYLAAGAAKTVITPPVGYHMGQWGLRQGRSTGVHRDLFCRSLVLADGDSRLAIASLEVCGLPSEIVEAIRKRTSMLTGIEHTDLLINSTHNHTAPDFLGGVTPEWRVYSDYLADLVAGSVSEAANAMRPAVAGHGRGKLGGWTVNRQYKNRPVDTEVGVLAINERDGTPLARLVNFAAHGVCDGGQYLTWSGDFAGEMSAAIEEIDAGAVAMHIQGAAGDIHPFDWWFGNHDSKHMHTHEDTAAFGNALAAEALRTAATVDMSADIQLACASATLDLPRRQVRWSVDEAKALHERLKAERGTYSGSVWPDGTTTANAAELHPEQYGSGRNELSLAERQGLPPVEIEVQAYRIGDLVISAHPGELFNELGTAIKDGSPGERPWVASYSNEYIGYVSTRAPYREIEHVPLAELVDMKRFRRFYGTTTSPYAPEAGERLAARAIEVLKQV
jgi:hypothetical protein